MSLPKTLRFKAYESTIEGCGSELTITLSTRRESAKGKVEDDHRHAVVLRLDRGQLGCFLKHVAQMHKRDRERLEWERGRIDREIAAVATS